MTLNFKKKIPPVHGTAPDTFLVDQGCGGGTTTGHWCHLRGAWSATVQLGLDVLTPDRTHEPGGGGDLRLRADP